MNTIAGASLISIVFGLIGLFLIFNYFRHRSKHQSSESWAQVEGKVVKSSVREEVSRDSDGDMQTTYYPEVEYVYSLLGQEFRGDAIVFGPKQGGGRSNAQKTVGKYPLDAKVTVYYDPDKPEESVLERSLSKTSLVYGIVCLAIAIVTFILQL
jgi:hypothetical protein